MLATSIKSKWLDFLRLILKTSVNFRQFLNDWQITNNSSKYGDIIAKLASKYYVSQLVAKRILQNANHKNITKSKIFLAFVKTCYIEKWIIF